MSARHGGRPDQERHPTERQNEYFIPGDGIMREVIQADICRYLGNDALVRPGTYQGRQGYFIRAYRNLTSEMIADLKEDSRRWANERSHLEQRFGYGQAPSYLSSNIHDERQQMGPTPGPIQGQPMGGQPPQYGNQQYGAGQPIAQQQYGAQVPPTGDNHNQYYTYTSGLPPNVSYPSSSMSSYSYDSSYQTAPRTANPHTTSPYGETASTYSGGGMSDYPSSGYDYPSSGGTPAGQQYQPNMPPHQGYPQPPRDPVGFGTDPRAAATNRHDASSRDGHRDQRRRR